MSITIYPEELYARGINWQTMAPTRKNARLDSLILTVDRDGDLNIMIQSIGLGKDFGYKQADGHIRTPFLGGGASDKMFWALRNLREGIMADNIRWSESPEHQRLPVVFPLFKPKPMVWRHMDDAGGGLGLQMMDDGSVKVAIQMPPDNDLGIKGHHIVIKPEVPYVTTYMYLGGLYQAIQEDNATLGHAHGNHA